MSDVVVFELFGTLRGDLNAASSLDDDDDVLPLRSNVVVV